MGIIHAHEFNWVEPNDNIFLYGDDELLRESFLHYIQGQYIDLSYISDYTDTNSLFDSIPRLKIRISKKDSKHVSSISYTNTKIVFSCESKIDIDGFTYVNCNKLTTTTRKQFFVSHSKLMQLHFNKYYFVSNLFDIEHIYLYEQAKVLPEFEKFKRWDREDDLFILKHVDDPWAWIRYKIHQNSNKNTHKWFVYQHLELWNRMFIPNAITQEWILQKIEQELKKL